MVVLVRGIMAKGRPFNSRNVHIKNNIANFSKQFSDHKIFYPPLIANLLLASPSSAEAGKIFDFNATLPIMAAQFLLLMVFLDKTWFGPVGKVLDERDAKIRARLSSVKVGGDELEALQKEAETLLKDARAETQAKISDAKEKAGAKAEAELAAEKSKLDAELARAVKDLETERVAAQKDIDQQVAELSKYIIKRVLPAGFSL